MRASGHSSGEDEPVEEVTLNTQEKMNSAVMGTYGRFPVVLAQGSHETCVDENGKQYIDFGSGIGTNSLGYCNAAWTEAVCRQAKTMQHTSNLYYTKVQADFAEALCTVTGYSKVFFGNSGAEANECAIKLARKYSFDKYGKGRHTILTLVNSFHGRTLCTLSATGQDVFHNYFFPFVEGFCYAEANNVEDLKAKLDDTVCAVMLEYVQGEGGVNALEQSFVDAVYALCAEKDILVITDEVQTGVGRTGTFLAGEQFGHKADVVTLAKGIAGGLPMGVCLANEKCAGVLDKGSHGSTFGGNPVCCAAGTAVLETVTATGFLQEVQKKAAYFREKLTAMPGVASVSGLGLMIGIALKEKSAADVANAALEQGLLVLTAKTKVRLLPPLTITYEEIDAGLAILARVIAS
jgi:acetylornithine/N-succinyldiaminopimelate aminotransferase